jgi:hypothetical protein
LGQLCKRYLAGRGGFGNWGIRQGASFPQSQDSRGQAHFSHRYGDEVSGAPGQTQQTDAVGERPRLRRNLDGIDPTVRGRVDVAWQSRGTLKVVHGKQNARRHGVLPNRLIWKRAQGFDFQITPPATGFACFNEPIEFALNVTGEFPARPTAAAGGDKCDLPEFARFEEAEESRAFLIIAQPIEAQLDSSGYFQSGADLPPHIRSGGGRDNSANPPYPSAKESHTPPYAANRLKTQLVACRIKSVKQAWRGR